MRHASPLILLFLLIGMSPQYDSKMLEFPERYERPVLDHTEHLTILVDGRSLVNAITPDDHLRLGPDASGILSLSTPNGSCASKSTTGPIGFKVAVKDYGTNTLWSFSDETMYELDLAVLLKNCALGDKLVIMTVDRRYRLPRHEIDILGGC